MRWEAEAVNYHKILIAIEAAEEQLKQRKLKLTMKFMQVSQFIWA